jgi:23S rRNA pseudouridine1911/1915/1917 synthase
LNIQLKEISFEHPVKKEKQKIVASLPENEFWEQFLSLDRVKVKDKDIGRIV